MFFVSSEQYKTQGDTRDYYFLLGLIHSVQEGVRGVSLTYGQTTINGRFITTGKIQSADGYNFIDLDANQFAIGNEKSGLDWNLSEKDTLTVKGAIIQKGQMADWIIDEGKITSRDKAASLDSKTGKFCINSGKGSQNRIEMSKDGVYSGHAGIDLKVDGKEVKAAVVGQRGRDEPNVFGGLFQGLLANDVHVDGLLANDVRAHGLIANALTINGLYLLIEEINDKDWEKKSDGSNFWNVNESSTLIILHTTKRGHIYLPSGPNNGRVIIIYSLHVGFIYVKGNGNHIRSGYGLDNMYYLKGWDHYKWPKTYIFLFCKNHWQLIFPLSPIHSKS